MEDDLESIATQNQTQNIDRNIDRRHRRKVHRIISQRCFELLKY